MMSNNLKSRKPEIVVIQICQVVISGGNRKGTARNVRAWPANSSATTSRGSSLPVAAIAAGAYLTQITEPARTRAAITIDIDTAGAWNWHITANMIAGGSEPHVPGAIGSRPRPKHDVSILFIFAEGYLRTPVKSKIISRHSESSGRQTRRDTLSPPGRRSSGP